MLYHQFNIKDQFHQKDSLIMTLPGLHTLQERGQLFLTQLPMIALLQYLANDLQLPLESLHSEIKHIFCYYTIKYSI